LRQDLPSILSSLPQSFQADRKELLALLLRSGILYRSPTQPITSRNGKSGRWLLNTLGVTLNTRGAELAGRCLLELLTHFDGHQLATYGLIGTPILQSCILQSGGRYRGLLVRKEAKTYGASRLIEGEIDPDEPVILADDSIASGTAFREGCERLQQAGLRVEGCVCLVRFGWLSGYSDLQEHGFHVEAVFDIFEDFMANMEGEPRPVRNPSKTFPRFQCSETQAPEGLHPAELARIAMREYLDTGKLVRPPQRMDKEYDSSGGAWVSVRSKSDIYVRHARDGFWNFPGEEKWPSPEAVVRSAMLTLAQLPRDDQRHVLLDSSQIAVTFFGEMEECTVGQLDNDRYGIVVCSRERASVMGGALPRMPGISGEFHQFQHAGITNGKLLPFEPYVIYRHDVAKYVEPGGSWPCAGVPAKDAPLGFEDVSLCGPIAARARDLAIASLLGVPETSDPLPESIRLEGLDSLFVTVYIWGRLRGCVGTAITNLDDDVRRLVVEALRDERFEDISADSSEAVAVSVSFLYNSLNIGQGSPEQAARCFIRGRQALHVEQGKRSGILLPLFAAMHSLNAVEYAKEVIDKAGITRPPYHWRRLDCVSWLADNETVGVMEGAFKKSDEALPLKELLVKLTDLQTAYLLRHQLPEGSFYESFEPFRARLSQGSNMPRLAHAGWILARAHRVMNRKSLQTAADRTIENLLARMRINDSGVWLEAGENSPSVSEVSFLALALCELPKGDHRRIQVRSLATTLWSSIDRHGRIATHRNTAGIPDAYQDYFPGQVLLALAIASEVKLTEGDLKALQRAFRYYRHRFRYKRDFGQISWLMQAFSAWWRVLRATDFSALVFEIGDWILQYQQEKTGAFINDHQSDSPGYSTALYLEGLAAALPVAESLDVSRYRRYLHACTSGLQFLERLTIQSSHAPMLPNTEYAIGGLRQSIYSSFVRLDFVQHALSCAVEMQQHLFKEKLYDQPQERTIWASQPPPINPGNSAGILGEINRSSGISEYGSVS
jgi:AMMECR1 domain-containing protein/orotate phosphoribosyltransferase